MLTPTLPWLSYWFVIIILVIDIDGDFNVHIAIFIVFFVIVIIVVDVLVTIFIIIFVAIDRRDGMRSRKSRSSCTVGDGAFISSSPSQRRFHIFSGHKKGKNGANQR